MAKVIVGDYALGLMLILNLGQQGDVLAQTVLHY